MEERPPQSTASMPPGSLRSHPLKLDLFIDAVLDYALYMLDRDGTIITWNRGAERLKGYAAGEVIGKHFSIFYPPEDKADGKPQRELETALEQGRFEEEGWRVRKDGSRMWANVVLTPVRDAAGELQGFAKVTRDITERRAVIEKLKLSEERFRLLVHAVKDYAIFMLLPDGTVASWNEGAQRAKGYLPQEIIGKHFSVFYTPEDRASGKPEDLLRLARTQGRVEDEGWRVRKDGSRFWVDVIITAVYNEQGEIRGFTKVTRDLTEKRQSEETIEKKQKQIVELQKMEAIGRLAGGIAHDINNLLAGILGCAEALESMVTGEPRAEAEEIEKACHRGRTLTQQLLAFSRRQISTPVSLQLNDVVRDLQHMLGRLVGTDVTLDLKLAMPLPQVKMDFGQLQQIVVNLVLNARDAMPNGGRIIVGTRALYLDEVSQATDFILPLGDYVMLSISDNGVGMTRDVQQRIFEPFFTTKELGKGTGLGLATVYGIIRQHQGGISVFTVPHQGTTFKVFMPAHGEGPLSPLEPVQPNKNETVLRGSETILVVEDDSLVLRNTVRSLQARGYTVLSASNGVEATVLLEKTKGKIQLVITDVIMPEMNGKQLADKIRVASPQLPVLFMSGYSADLIAEQGILTASVAFLEKPFDALTLAQKVREVLDKSL